MSELSNQRLHSVHTIKKRQLGLTLSIYISIYTFFVFILQYIKNRHNSSQTISNMPCLQRENPLHPLFSTPFLKLLIDVNIFTLTIINFLLCCFYCLSNIYYLLSPVNNVCTILPQFYQIYIQKNPQKKQTFVLKVPNNSKLVSHLNLPPSPLHQELPILCFIGFYNSQFLKAKRTNTF